MQTQHVSLDLPYGIRLKKTQHSPYWQYYYKLAGRQFRQSTKTPDQLEAKRIAQDAYNDTLRKIESGECLEEISFNSLHERYVKTLQGQNKYTFHSETLSRHFKPYFGKFKDINRINKHDLHSFIESRKEKFRKSHGRELKPQSINKETAVFNQMMRYAHDCGWLKKDIKFNGLSERYSHCRRPHFTHEQYITLIKTSREHCNALKQRSLDKADNQLNNSKYTNAMLLHDIILILAHTGMRVDEIKTVRWSHIDLKNYTIKLQKAGKTRSSRLLTLRSEAIASIKKIKERRLDYIALNGGQFSEQELIQALPSGKPVLSFKKGFAALLQRCGFVYKTIEDRHTMTSLRHTFATYRLTTPSKAGIYISPYQLAKQMGTSVKMIEKHYGHDCIQDYQDLIRS